MGIENHGMGAATEHRVAAFFLSNGYEVWWPSRGQSRADFVVEKGGRFQKVQAKTAHIETGDTNTYVRVRLSKPSRGSRPYEAGDFDLLAVRLADALWIVPAEDLPDQKTLCLFKRGPTVRPWTKYDPSDWRVK